LPEECLDAAGTGADVGERLDPAVANQLEHPVERALVLRVSVCDVRLVIRARGAGVVDLLCESTALASLAHGAERAHDATSRPPAAIRSEIDSLATATSSSTPIEAMHCLANCVHS